MLLLDAPRAPSGVPSPFARLRAADAARHVAGVSPRAARFLVRAGDARGDDVLLRGAPACVGAALADLADDARPPASRRATLVPSEPPLLCQGPARDLARKLWACAQEILPWSFDADRVPDVVTDRFVGVDEGGVRVIEHGRDTAFVDFTPRLDHIDVDGAAGAVRARALRDAFDVVNEPEPHELKLVAGWLAPRHDRLLAALAALGDAAHVEKRGRLLWRITTAPTLAVGARLEPPGRLPRLRRVSLRAVADGSVACACEAERTAAALVLAGRPADAVRALAGHPAVVVDGRGGAAFRVVDAPLGAALLDVDAGFSVELVAAGVRVPAMAVAAAAIGEAVVAVDRRARVVVVTQPTPSLRALAAAVASTGGFVPAAARTAVAGAVRGLSTATVPVSLPSSFAPPRRAPADARLFVRLSDEDSGLMVAIGVRPDRSARLLPPGEGPGLVAGLVDGRRADLLRDRDDEVERARSLRATIDVDGTFLGDGWGAVIAPGDDADLAFLERLHREVRRRDDVVLEWRDPDKAKTVEGELTAAALRLRVRSIEGWLGVEGGVELDGAVLSFAALLEAVRAGRKYVALSPGRFVAIAASVGGLLAPLAGAGPAARLAAPVAAEALAALADAGAVFDDTDAWRDVARRVELARACTGDPPAGLCADLRPYQRTGCASCAGCKRGAPAACSPTTWASEKRSRPSARSSSAPPAARSSS